MPAIRDYPQATSLQSTDAFVIDRVTQGTMFIEGINASNLTVTDGTHTVTGVNNIDFIAGATVGGSTPNATVSVSGGSGGLQVATRTLSSADIEALNPSIFTLVAGVPGKYIWPVATYYQYKFGTVAYTSLHGTNGNAGLYYNNPPSLVGGWLDPGNFGNTTPALGLALVELNSTLIFSPGWSGLMQQLGFANPGADLVIAAPGGGFNVGGDGTCLVTTLYTTITSFF